jgi:hypothetical protein
MLHVGKYTLLHESGYSSGNKDKSGFCNKNTCNGSSFTGASCQQPPSWEPLLSLVQPLSWGRPSVSVLLSWLQLAYMLASFARLASERAYSTPASPSSPLQVCSLALAPPYWSLMSLA